MMLYVDLQMCARTLLEAVSNRSRMPPGAFSLYYQSKQLEGGAALSSWGLQKNAVIELKTRGPGGAVGSLADDLRRASIAACEQTAFASGLNPDMLDPRFRAIYDEEKARASIVEAINSQRQQANDMPYGPRPQQRAGINGGSKGGGPICYVCGVAGHLARNCWQLLSQQSQQQQAMQACTPSMWPHVHTLLHKTRPPTSHSLFATS